MNEKHSKTELLGATRQILTEIAAWTDTLFSTGAAERLIGIKPGRDPEFDDGGVISCIERRFAVSPRKWTSSGSAGPIIEQSLVIKQLSRVIDYLNTNTWHGDSIEFFKAKLELTPFRDLLARNWAGRRIEQSAAINYAIDDAIDPEAASTLVQVLKIFSARANFERDCKELTIGELALISGLAEKTVRMAAIGQNKNPDLVTFKDGHFTFVTIEEAHRWMASKNIDYRSPDYTESNSLPPVDPTNLSELGTYLWRARNARNLEIDVLATQLRWNKSMIRDYRKLEEGGVEINLDRFSVKAVMQIAQTICPPESRKLVHVIDRIIHPLQLEKHIEQGFK
jgi:hypothetical protein